MKKIVAVLLSTCLVMQVAAHSAKAFNLSTSVTSSRVSSSPINLIENKRFLAATVKSATGSAAIASRAAKIAKTLTSFVV